MWTELLTIVRGKIVQPRDKELSGIATAAGRLIAVRNPQALGVTNKSSSASIEVSIQEKSVRHGHPPECVRVADSQRPSVTLDSAEDGSYMQSVSLGQRDVPQNEEGSEEVCKIAIEYLNAIGGNWDLKTLKVCDQHGDVDASASDGIDKRKMLNIQVTRAFPEPSFFKKLHLDREVKPSRQNPEKLAHNLFQAIERKAKKLSPAQKANLVLAIDVVITPVLSLNAIIEAFQNAYPGWANSLGFRSILVVGPVDSLTHRVDT